MAIFFLARKVHTMSGSLGDMIQIFLFFVLYSAKIPAREKAYKLVGCNNFFSTSFYIFFWRTSSSFLALFLIMLHLEVSFFAFSLQVEDVSHLAGLLASGVKVQEGVEITEMAEAMAVVVTLMAGENMVIGMAIGEGFLAVEVMGIREMIIWVPAVAAWIEQVGRLLIQQSRLPVFEFLPLLEELA